MSHINVRPTFSQSIHCRRSRILCIATLVLLYVLMGSTTQAANVYWKGSGAGATGQWGDDNWLVPAFPFPISASPVGNDVYVGDLLLFPAGQTGNPNAANDFTNLDDNYEIESLTITNNVRVHKHNYRLTVNGLTTIENGFIFGGLSTLDTKGLSIASEGGVGLFGGIVELVEGLLTNDGVVEGYGTIELVESGPTGGVFVNNGVLEAVPTFSLVSPRVLTITNENNGVSSGTGKIDLDGTTEAGRVLIGRSSGLDRELRVEVPLADAFNGSIELFDECVLDFSHAWTLEGSLQSLESAVRQGPGIIRGGILTVGSGGSLDLRNLRLENELLVSGGVANLPIDGKVEFNGGATFDSGDEFSNPGNGTIEVNSSVRIGTGNTGNFNWDGGGSTLSTTNVNSAGTLLIDTDTVDSVSNDFDGTINVNSGVLEVDVTANQWQMDGTMTLTKTTSRTPRLKGDNVLVTGNLVANSGSHLDVTKLTVSDGGVLEANGDNVDIDAIVDVQDGGEFLVTGVVLDVTTVPELLLRGSVGTPARAMVRNVTLRTTEDIAIGFATLQGELALDNGVIETLGDISTGPLSTLKGTGLLDVDSSFTNDGTVAPESFVGNTSKIGQISISGNFVNSATGTLEIEIEVDTFSRSDRINATSLDLAGILEVTLLDGSEPSLGDEFRILNSNNGRTGTFDTVNLPSLGGNLALEVQYDALGVSLLTVPELDGDFDHDGDVDGADFLAWQRNPGVGNLSDWQNNYGTSLPLAAASAVPEPTTLLLMTLALPMLRTRRTR